MKQTTVGTSSRTPFKHWLLNHMLGRVVGALSTGKTPCNPVLWVVDMCAGDGMDCSESAQSSPSIIYKHITSQFHGSHRIRSRTAHLFEREDATFSRLASRFGGHEKMNLSLADSKGWTIRKIPARAGDCIFVYADPNSVATLPVTPELIDSFTTETLFLMTLGCNVGGCKRLPREDREQWKRTALQVIDRTHRRHDTILVWLNKDAAQWAYLAAVPRVWSEGTLSAAIKAGNKLWPSNGVSGISLKTHGKQAMADKFNELFLTQDEIKTAR